MIPAHGLDSPGYIQWHLFRISKEITLDLGKSDDVTASKGQDDGPIDNLHGNQFRLHRELVNGNCLIGIECVSVIILERSFSKITVMLKLITLYTFK